MRKYVIIFIVIFTFIFIFDIIDSNSLSNYYGLTYTNVVYIKHLEKKEYRKLGLHYSDFDVDYIP